MYGFLIEYTVYKNDNDIWDYDEDFRNLIKSILINNNYKKVGTTLYFKNYNIIRSNVKEIKDLCIKEKDRLLKLIYSSIIDKNYGSYYKYPDDFNVYAVISSN